MPGGCLHGTTAQGYCPAVSFLDELCAFLESVRAGEIADLQLSREVRARHRRQLESWFEAARRAPDADTADAHASALAYGRWLRRCDDGLLELLYEHVDRAFASPPVPLVELVDGALAGLVGDDEHPLVRAPEPGIAAQLGPVRARTLWHAADEAAAEFKRRNLNGVPSFRRTCELLRLVRRRGGEVELAPAADLLLQLGRREGTRWLLALELASDIVPDEPSRVGTSVARRLLQRGAVTLVRAPDHGLSALEQPREHQWVAGLGRWVAMGVLTHRFLDFDSGEEIHEDDEPRLPPDEVFALADLGRSLLTDLLSDTPHPLMELARAMLDDEDSAMPPDFQWPMLAAPGVVRGLSRYTRTLTHEVRNALLPVQLASQQVMRKLQGSELEDSTRRHLATVEAGLTRIFEFVDNWRRVMERAEEADEPFLIVPAVRAAIAAMGHECENPIELHVGAGADGASVKGKRDPLTQAVVELIRNAIQVGGPAVSIEIGVERDAERVVVEVTNDGPGVPGENRERIFERGFTTRSGGTGQGLTAAREIVLEMSGDLRLVDSSDGCVRFAITLPIYSGGAS